MTTKSMNNKKKKIDKLDLIEIKNIFASKDIIKKVQRLLTGWKKIYANYISHKGLLSIKYRMLTTQQDK